MVAYLAFSIPALIAGVATSRFGLYPTALVYSAAVAALAAVAAALLLFRHERHEQVASAPAQQKAIP